MWRRIWRPRGNEKQTRKNPGKTGARLCDVRHAVYSCQPVVHVCEQRVARIDLTYVHAQRLCFRKTLARIVAAPRATDSANTAEDGGSSSQPIEC
jgi:hypothetical protein